MLVMFVVHVRINATCQNARTCTLYSKGKRPDIYIQPLTGKPEQRSRVLTSISSRQRSAISGRPLPERSDFESAVCSSADPRK